MLTPQISTGMQGINGASIHYGYGLWVAQQGEALSYHMFGGDPGVSFYSGMYVEQNVQLTLMGNIVNPFSDMRDRIMSFLG